MNRFVAKSIAVLTAVLILVVGIHVRASDGTKNVKPDRTTEIDILMGHLNDSDMQARRRAKDDILGMVESLRQDLPRAGMLWSDPAYQLLIKRLCAVVSGAPERTDQDLSTGLLAVQILGEIRAPEAVEVLLDRILFSPAVNVSERSLVTLYPCLGTLIRIGHPAVTAIIRRMERPAEGNIIRLYGVVVTEVPGGADRVRRELERIRQAERNAEAMLRGTRN